MQSLHSSGFVGEDPAAYQFVALKPGAQVARNLVFARRLAPTPISHARRRVSFAGLQKKMMMGLVPVAEQLCLLEKCCPISTAAPRRSVIR
jgi:hypothetical protein